KMDVKFVYLKDKSLEQVFFGGEDVDKQKTEGYGKNTVVTHRCFKLFSPDFSGGIEVFVPANMGDKDFKFKTKVNLLNPYIKPVAVRLNGNSNRAFASWELYVDDLVPYK
ncbi:TPA: DUF961 family protein, partial [Listeria monocytogenes]